MSSDTDTIVALSSGALPSGVAVIRISGPETSGVLERVSGALPEARRLTLRPIVIGSETLDHGLVAWFPAPQSFTGDDCAELHVHGSPAVVRALLRGLVTHDNVRLADAGEFTRRAFANGKLDLIKVEGLSDLILAETESQRQQALARLAGGLSDQVLAWRETLLDLRAEIEARLDFSDESDVSAALPAAFGTKMAQLLTALRAAADSVGHGRIVREGLRVALAGPPNAGKSSLLNALAKSELAIVTDEPGTTRDVREVQLDLGGRLVVLVDMAGLRDSASKAEAEGVRRARDEIARADLVLWLMAPDVPPLPALSSDVPMWRVATKADLGPASANHVVSALTGEGIVALVEALSAFAAMAVGSGPPALVSRERDLLAIEAAHAALVAYAGTSDEIAAEHLRQASLALERLLGRIDTEHVLDRLFSAFCIGK